MLQNAEQSCKAEDVREAFKNRCARCMKPGAHVHEIVPKSINKNWNKFSNRILLCASCHNDVHKGGATTRTEELKFYWYKRLVDFYGNRNENGLAESRFVS